MLFAVFCTGFVWSQPTTVTLSPSDDAQMSSKFPTIQYGTLNTMSVSYDSRNLLYRSAIKFDLSTIPFNATIISAFLYIKPKNALPNQGFTDHRLSKYLASWSQASITHANAPSVDPNGISTSVGEGGWRKFDVKTDIQGFANGSSTNYGWQIRLSNETSTAAFDYYTKEYTTPSFRPYLVVQYYAPLTVTNASINHVSEINSTNGSVTPTIIGGSGDYTYEWTNGSTGSLISTNSTLSGVGYGWYGLHISDANFDIDSYMAFLVGAECSSVTIDFKPGPEYVDDALLNNFNKTGGPNYGNVNYGGHTTYQNENWTNGIWFNMKNVIKFKLWMDNAFIIDQADLTMIGYQHYPLSRPNTSELRKVNQPWAEYGVTYNNQPSTTTPVVTIPTTTITSPVSQTNDNKTVDISSYWNSWKTNNTLNYGLLMQLQLYNNQYTRMQFHSSDATSPANRPWIQFGLHFEPSEACYDYAKMERTLRGVNYKTYLNVFHFYIEEEYTTSPSTNLNFKVYSETDRVNPVLSGSGLYPVIYGDNRYDLDVSTIANGTYVLEVKNDKNEIFYIRFTKQ